MSQPRIWFTSDLHLGHERVAKLRGFTSTHHHDEHVLATWKSQVGGNDTVWVLGDISSGGAVGQRSALEKISAVPGKKFLVAGNHDAVHPLHGRTARKWDREYRTVFDYVCSQAAVRLGGHRVMLSHFPYEVDRGEPRFMEWRLRDTGRLLLHGHTHSSELWTSKREIHVGWDAHGGLVPHADIEALVAPISL